MSTYLPQRARHPCARVIECTNQGDQMKRSTRHVVLAAAALAVALPAGAAFAAHGHHDRSPALWASPTGSGTACTQVAPCTLTVALATAPTHSTVHATAGTYSGGYTLATTGLRLVGDEGATVDATTATNGIGILVTASHTAVTGVTVTGAPSAAQTAPHANPPLPEGAGIEVKGANDVTISHDTLTGNVNTHGSVSAGNNPSWGIWLMGTSHSAVSFNRVFNNDGGIYLTDETGPTTANVISHNTVHTNAYGCGITLASHHAGVFNGTTADPTLGGVFNNVVRNNVANDNGTIAQGSGILMGVGAPGGAVYNNLILDNSARGNGLGGITIHQHFNTNVPFPGATVGDANGNRLIGNHIGTNNIGGDDDFAPITDHLTTGIILASITGTNITGTVIRNNQISNNKIGIWLLNAPTQSNTIRHNHFHHVTTKTLSQTG